MPLIDQMKMVLELVKDLPEEKQRLLARHLASVVRRHEDALTMTTQERNHIDELQLKERVFKIFGRE